MSECEEINAFKKNLRILASSVADAVVILLNETVVEFQKASNNARGSLSPSTYADKQSLAAEMEKVWSWINWTDQGPQHNRACTPAHQDHMRIHAAADIAHALLRRKYIDPATEGDLAMKYFRWCLDIAACNLGKRLDTDRLFQLIATPDFAFYSYNDKVSPYRQVLQLLHQTTLAATTADSVTTEVIDRAPPNPQETSLEELAFDTTLVTQLRPEDYCDFLRDDGQWVFARIVELSPTETEIHVEDLQNNERFWVSVEDDAHRFAKMCTRSSTGTTTQATVPSAAQSSPVHTIPASEVEYRKSAFVRGFMIDAKDKTGKWYQAVILDRRAQASSSDAQLTDELRVSYLGFNSKSDEWIALDSPRLDRLNYSSVGRRGTNVAVGFETDQEREPPSSEFTDTDPTNLPALVRPVSNFPFQKGPVYVELLNYFWCNQLDAEGSTPMSVFLQRLTESQEATSNKESFQWVASFAQTLSYSADIYTQAFGMYHIQFYQQSMVALHLLPSRAVQTIIAQFLAFVDTYVGRMTEDDVRGVTKDWADVFVVAIKRLARRITPDATTAGKRAEDLQLQLALKCLRSSQIMRRLDGLKLFSEARNVALNACLYPSGVSFFASGNEYIRWPLASWVRPAHLAKWVADHNILHDIFVARHHRQLVKLAGDLLRVLHSDLQRTGSAGDEASLITHELIADVLSSLSLGAEDAAATVTLICETVTELPPSALQHILTHLLRPSAHDSTSTSTTAPGPAESDISASTIKMLNAIMRSDPRNPVDAVAVAKQPGSSAAVVLEATMALATLAFGLKPGATSVALDASLAEAAMKSLLSALQHSCVAALRMPLMQMSLHFIDWMIEPAKSIELLKGIIDTYPSQRPVKAIEIPKELLTAEFVANPDAATAHIPVATAVSPSELKDSEMCISDVLELLDRKHNLVEVLLRLLQRISNSCLHSCAQHGLVPLHYIQAARAGTHVEKLMKMLDASGAVTAQNLPVLKETLESAASFTTEQLQKYASDVDKLVLNLTKNITDAQACTQEWTNTTKTLLSSVLANKKQTGVATFSVLLRNTFSFLGYVLQRSRLTLNVQQVDAIWNTCVSNCISVMHRSLCLMWFTLAVSFNLKQGKKETSLYIADEVAVSLFRNRLNSEEVVLQAAVMDVPLFTAWRMFFVLCNVLSSALSINPSALAKDVPDVTSPVQSDTLVPDSHLTVTALDLEGLDSLWDITLQAADSTVANSAVSLLTAIQQRLSPSLAEHAVEHRSRYVNRCLRYIKNAVDIPELDAPVWCSTREDLLAGVASPGTTRQRSAPSSATIHGNQLIKRCIALIESLLDESEDDTFGVVDRIRRLLALAHLSSTAKEYTDVLADQHDNLVEMRRFLLHHLHAPWAHDFADPLHKITSAGRKVSGWITIRLNVSVKIYGDEPAVAEPSAGSSETKVEPETVPIETAAATSTSEVEVAAGPVYGPALPESAPKVDVPKDEDAKVNRKVKRAVMADDVKIRIRVNEPLYVLRFLVSDLFDLDQSQFRMLIPPSSLDAGVGKPREVRASMLSKSAAQLGLRDGATIPVISKVPTSAQATPVVSPQGTSTPKPTAATPLPSPVVSSVSVPATLGEPEELRSASVNTLETLAKLPSFLLAAQPEWMNVLIGLYAGEVGLDSETLAKVWRLLCRLPTHAHFLEQLYQTNDKSTKLWDEALSRSSVGKYLYGLMGVHRIISSRIPADAVFARDYASAFADPVAFARSRVVGGANGPKSVEAAELRMAEVLSSAKVEEFTSSAPLRAWQDNAVDQASRSWLIDFVENGGLDAVIGHLQRVFATSQAFWQGNLTPLDISAAATSLEFVTALFRECLRCTNNSINNIPFKTGGVVFTQLYCDAATAKVVLARLTPDTLVPLASQMLRSMAAGGVENTLRAYGETGIHGASVMSIHTSVISLWAALLIDKPTLWASNLKDGSVNSLVQLVYDDTQASTTCLCQVAAVAAVALHVVVNVDGAAEQLRTDLLNTLLHKRPAHTEATLSRGPRISIYFALLECVLRSVLQREVTSGGRLGAAYVKIAANLVEDLKRFEPIETDTGAAIANTAMYGTLCRNDVWKGDEQPANTATINVAADPLAGASAYFTAIHKALVKEHEEHFAVSPMEAAFVNFAASDASHSLSFAQTPPTVSSAITPLNLALADTAQGAQMLSSFSNSNFLLEDEVCARGVGVDQVLAGTLRLLTALCDADPLLAGDLGLPPIASTTVGATPGIHPLLSQPDNAVAGGMDLVRFVYKECLSKMVTPSTEDADNMGKDAVFVDPSTHEAYALLQRLQPSTEKTALCKSFITRRAGFRLLISLIRRSSRNTSLFAHTFIAETGTHFESKGDYLLAPIGWRQDPASRDCISSVGYVGLRNLGCICYMNSLMQQFFMCEPLRYGLLSVPKCELFTDEQKADSVLYQLQRMFGFLDISTRKHYDPSSWCNSYKDYDGRPTNVLVQQDAQEYLTTLLDRVEFELKGTPQHKLIQRVLGLETKEARFCTGGCGTMRSSSEPNVTLSVSVTQGNMKSSLDAYSAWEDIPDYSCDECKKRTLLKKRNTIGSLSNTLIVHLKRFEMNYDTGMPIKLNNRFEFPNELDLYPYSYECYMKEQVEALRASGRTDIPDVHSEAAGYYEFELVGVVVHMGTLESGHYYSFIRERGPRAFAKTVSRAAAVGEDAPSVDDPSTFRGQWMEFNDSLVTPFDPTKIPEQCYGGTTTVTSWNTALNQHVSTETPIVKNAYMLVYERKSPLPIEVPAADLPHISTTAPTVFVSPKELVPLDSEGRGAMPSSVLADVIFDNQQLARLCRVTELEYSLLLHSFTDALTRQELFCQPTASMWPPIRDVSSDTAICSRITSKFAQDMTAAKQRGKDAEVKTRDAYRQALQDALFALPDYVPKLPLLRLLVLHCFVHLGHTAHMHLVPHFAYNLSRWIARHPEELANPSFNTVFRAVVCGDYELLKETLMKCPVNIVRGSFARLILSSLVAALHTGGQSRLLLPYMERVASSTGKLATAPTASLACDARSFIQHLLSQDSMDTLSASWKYMNTTFQLLYDLARFGFGSGIPLFVEGADPSHLRAYVIGDASATITLASPGSVLRSLIISGHRVRQGLTHAKAIETILDLYMLPKFSLFALPPTTGKKRTIMGTKTVSPTWTRAFDLITLLVRGIFTRGNESWASISPWAVILGPIESQTHGIAWLENFKHLSTELPADSTSDAVQWVAMYNSVLARSREYEEAVGQLPGFARDPTNLSIISPFFQIPHALQQQLPAPSPLDAPIMQRSRDRVLSAQRQYGVLLEKLVKNKSLTIGGQTITRIEDIPRSFPCVLDVEGENVFNPLDAKGMRIKQDLEEGFVLLDTVIDEKTNQLRSLYNEQLWRLLLGMEDAAGDHHFPDPFGPNIEAVSQLLGHLVYCDRLFTAKTLTLLTTAIESASIDKLRPLFALCEALMAVPDQFQQLRRSKLFGCVLDCLKESANGSLVETSMDYVHFLIRALCFHPSLAAANLTPQSEALYVMEEFLRRVECNPKEGWGKCLAWQALLVSPEGRPEAANAKNAAANLSDREKEILPVKHCMLSHLAHPAGMLRLPLREEWQIVGFVGMNASLRATLYLQRLERVCKANGLSLLGYEAVMAVKAQKGNVAEVAGAGAPPALQDITHDLD